MSHKRSHLSVMRRGQTERSLSRRRGIRVRPAPAFKTHPRHLTHNVGTRTDGFLKASATRRTRNNVGAYSAAWDRALAQHIPRVSLTRAAITKITLPIRTLPPPPQPPSPPPPPLAGKLDQRLWYARNSPRSTRLENARFHLERRSLLLHHLLLLFLLLAAAIRPPIPIVVRRSLRLVAVVVVTYRACSRAASFAGDHGESRRHGEWRTRVRRRPTHTDPPIYLLIQCNSMRLSHAYTRVFSRLSSSSLSPFLARIQPP